MLRRIKRKKYFTLFLIFFVSIVWATGQISDSLYLDGKVYSILSVRGRLLYPSDFGIEASPPHTANVHGYYSEYKIENEKLFLSKITINSKDGKYPSINGIEADLDENKACYKHPKKNIDFCTTDGGVYKNVNKLIPLTGKLLLGRDFIKERYVHSGWQKPSAFREILDLEFHNGELIKIDNLSNDRSKIPDHSLEALDEIINFYLNN